MLFLKSLPDWLGIFSAMGQGSTKTDLHVTDPDAAKGQDKENVQHRKGTAAAAKKRFQKGRS